MTIRDVLVFASLAAPWLNPMSGGPSTTVQSWLVGAACGVVVAALLGMRRPIAAAGCAGALLVALAFVGAGATLDTLALAGGVLLVAVLAHTHAPGAEAPIAASWLLAALLSTAIALAQYFGVADPLAPFVSNSAQFEAYANLRQRNQFATLTAIGAAALLWRVGAHGRFGAPEIAAAVLLAAGNAATASRTGFVELLALAAIAIAWAGREGGPVRRAAVALLLAYLASSFALPALQQAADVATAVSVWDRVAGGSSCSSRTVLWSNVLHVIAQKPWTGWGWGELDYAHYATLYPGARFCDILDNAHNLPLHLAAELGVPVAVLVCGAIAWWIVRQRPWAEVDTTRRLAWSVLLILGLHSLLEYPLWYGPFQIALGLALGLLLARGETAPAGTGSHRRRSFSASLLAFALLAATAYAAWDYRRVSQIYLPPEDRLPAYQDDTLAHIRGSRLFRNYAAFAELTLTPLERANAQWTLDESLRLLHYSPEPKIIEKVIESATMLGQDDVALWHLARYRAAFPEAHAEWARKLREPVRPPAQGAT